MLHSLRKQPWDNIESTICKTSNLNSEACNSRGIKGTPEILYYTLHLSTLVGGRNLGDV